jgi:acyl-CoA synthetase (AMP-forming)/AMP-acid ligase II
VEYNLADLFEAVAGAVGDRIALVAGDRRLTYADLDGRANRLAHHLLGAGIGAGSFVGVQLANGAEYLEVMLACFKIRAVPVNVNYRYVASELRHLYGDARLSGLVFHSTFAAAVAEAVAAVPSCTLLVEVLDEADRSGLGIDYETALAGAADGRGFERRSADDLYCVYTGGTTGMPKGVLWRHEDIFFAAMGGGDPMSLGNVIGAPGELAERVRAGMGLAALPASPLMHAAAHWLAFSMLFGGGKVVVVPSRTLEPDALWPLVARESVNILVVVGDAVARPLLDWLEARGSECDTSSLMAIGSGGAALSRATKRRIDRLLPGRIVADAFGSSETGQLGGSAPADDPQGPPRLHVDARTNVLDADLRPVPPGSAEPGHLARSGHIPVGYLGDPDKTAATFVEADGRRWALSGDLATVADDGAITVLGRGSLSINTGGEKVFPDEVEAVLKEHEDVVDALVVGLLDEEYGERVTAVVQLRPGADAGLETLRSFCRDRLAAYKIPRAVAFVDEVRRSPAGKADYGWARRAAEDGVIAG